MSPDPSRHVPLRQPTAFHVPVCLPPLPAANRKTCLVARPAMSLHDLARASPGPGRLGGGGGGGDGDLTRPPIVAPVERSWQRFLVLDSKNILLLERCHCPSNNSMK